MKEKKKIENWKLGMMVLAGILFLIFSLYMIGISQNIFGTSITLISVTENVKGLVPGNNVHFQGLNVGTVKSLEMANDSTIHITMLVQKKMQPFIKKNAITSINTDGLMGNKIIHIIPQEGFAEQVVEGDILLCQTPLDTDEMLAKLGSTGDYLQTTLKNLADVSEKLNQSESLWALLSDNKLPQDLKKIVGELRNASANAGALVKSGKELMENFEEGNGIVQKAFTDSVLAENLNLSIENILKTTEDGTAIILNIRTIVDNIESGEGAAGLFVNDSLMRESLIQTILNLEKSTYNFNENMEALKHNFLVRKYFKKQEKELKKEEKRREKEKEF